MSEVLLQVKEGCGGHMVGDKIFKHDDGPFKGTEKTYEAFKDKLMIVKSVSKPGPKPKNETES